MNPTHQSLIDGLKQHIEQINNILLDCDKENLEVSIAVLPLEDFGVPEVVVTSGLALAKVVEVLEGPEEDF